MNNKNSKNSNTSGKVGKLDSDSYRRLCHQISIGMVVADSELKVQLCNSSACGLFSVQEDQIVGQDVGQIIPEARRRLVHRVLQRSLRSGRGGQFRLRIKGAGQEYKDLAVEIVVIPDAQGRWAGVALLVRDQTARLELEKQVISSEKLVSIGRMSGGLAHHFNNILGGIVTAVDHALQVGDHASARRALELVAEATGRASELTGQLLKLATVDQAEADLADLTEVVIGFVEKIEGNLAGENITLDLEIKTVPIFAVHKSRIKQILGAMLQNARDALKTMGGGQIQLILDSDKQQVLLYFCDSGPGVAAKIAERIFEPFFTTKGAIGGGDQASLGLGLTVAGRLADEMGGNLQCLDRREHSGACFVLRLPLKRAKQ